MTSPRVEVEVLIVGYGPVGAALAGLLGRYGVRTLVVDKSPGIFMAPRAIALDNEALRILQMVGLADDAFAKVAIPYVRLRCPHLGEFGRINTEGSIDGHPKLVTFYQPELERALRANAERQSSVSARTGVELVRFVDDVGAVTAVLRASGGEESVVRARYLVGADGASSEVRGAIGEEFVGETYAEDWLVIDALDVPGPTFDHVEFLCDPDRPTPHMVAPGGRTRWEFMLKPGETREEMERDAKISELLRPWVKAESLRIERKAVYRFHARACRRFSKGRVFLAGDAAHITPPFVGQGLVAGLRDAANLAWKLAWVLRGRASPTILDTYDQERRPHAKKMIALAKFFGQLIMPRSHAKALLVHGAMALLRRISSVRALFDDLGIKPQNAFARGLFVPGGARRLRGTWLPQGPVRSPAGSITRSDEVLGPELALVGLGADPRSRLSERTLRRWSRAGGRTVHVAPRGEQASARWADGHEDVSGRLVPRTALPGWCLVVRPDRTVLHDGPTADADRIVRESLRLLGSPAP
jgi:3-(3-hydroxy-phenyl)propionate hydroxylase